jgi:flagellar protein FlgJ
MERSSSMKITPEMMIKNIQELNKIKVEEGNSSEFKKLLDKAINTKEDIELMEVCKQFETIFTNMMLKSMRGTVPKSELIPTSFGREIFESMYDEKLSEEISKGQGIGLAQMLYQQLKSKVEVY